MCAHPVADTATGMDGGNRKYEPESELKLLDPKVTAVLEEFTETDINEDPPIELMAKVQEW